MKLHDAHLNTNSLWGRIRKMDKKHIFPLVVIVLMLVLTLFRISGTSIGIYNQYFSGPAHDPSLLFGHPQAVRSDEWLVNTQYTIAQSKAGFPEVNPNIYAGVDVSTVVDVPYKDWSTVFRPQNFSFFMMPLENAFAFKWWFALVLLLVSSYYFFYRLTKTGVWPAILFSIVCSFSPFLFWWYTYTSLACVAYAFFIALISMSIINATRLKIFRLQLTNVQSLIVKVIALGYLLTSFGLLLYPPFQIPIALVLLFFLLGYLFNSWSHTKKYELLKIVGAFVLALGIAVTFIVTFILTRKDVVDAISHTVYPGARSIPAGGFDVKRLLTSYTQIQLQRDDRDKSYLTNQSEASTFLVQPIFLLLPTVLLAIFVYIRNKKIDWILVFMILVNLLFLADLFVPAATGVVKLFFLNLVPHERLLMGLGMLGAMNLAYAIVVLGRIKVDERKLLFVSSIYIIGLFAAGVWAGVILSHQFPLFISSLKLILLLSGLLFGSLWLILIRQTIIGLGILAVFALASTIFIQPLYQGLGMVGNLGLQAIQKDTGKKWISTDSIYTENIPQTNGVASLSGVQPYPQFSVWNSVAPGDQQAIFNRYAHVVYQIDRDPATEVPTHLEKKQSDFFSVISEPCSAFLKSNKVGYILSEAPINAPCLSLEKTMRFPVRLLFVYRIR